MKIFKECSRWAQILVLALLLLVGWSVASVFKIAKRDREAEQNEGFLGALSVPTAHADVPLSSTPFWAVWDGNDFKLENDFLFGKPKSYFADFETGRRAFEAGNVSGDLYKIQNKFERKDGRLVFQIQEIEPEESFLSRLSLARVLHPQDAEVFTSSDYRRFHVFQKSGFMRHLVSPVIAVNKRGDDVGVTIKAQSFGQTPRPEEELSLKKHEGIELTFTGLRADEKHHLVVKSRSRVWVMGEAPSRLAQARALAHSLLSSPVAARGLPLVASLGMLVWLGKRGLVPPAVFSPFVLTAGCVGATGATGATSGDPACVNPKCLNVSYKNRDGKFIYLDTIEPRAWQYATELLEVPRDAVSESGALVVRIDATEDHILGYVGLLRDIPEVPYRSEQLSVARAYHRRLNCDVADMLSGKVGGYVHTIPGDIVDVEFSAPALASGPEQQETYLLQASGFYTCLSSASKKLAGNWPERLSAEAKTRLAMITRRRLPITTSC